MDSTPTRMEKFIILLTVIIPFAAVPIGVVQVWGWGVDWPSIGLFAGFFLLSGLGVTVGYHRLFTHRSFETGRVLKILLAILGSLAVEGPLITWVARHNEHHRKSDRDGDPHSPLDGIVHAHFGFFFTEKKPDEQRYANHLLSDPDIVWVSRLFPVWTTLSLFLPAIIGFAISGTLAGAFLGFLWGGLIRIFFVHHLTWSINSICHVFGTRRFNTRDESRNNLIFGIIGFGEGWHHNHHAFPGSARHGLKWWELDISFLVIRALEKLGLVWNVRVPSKRDVTRKEFASN